MRFIGADLHKKSITFCVVELEKSKTVVVQRQRVLCKEVEKIRSFLKAHRPCELVVEATIGFDWFASLTEEFATRVILAHPGKLRVIAESTRKTDKVDAFVLAEFLAKDMIPEAWRPTPRVRQHRTLLRRRCKIQSRITSVKNSMRALLTRYNEDRQNLFSKVGWEASRKIKLMEQERWVLEDLHEELNQQRQRLRKLDQQLIIFAQTAPVLEREAREILATMPGVGVVTIDTILAELGDWRRFRNAKSVVSFAGLDPGVRSSDGKRHDLKLTKAGSPLLRWIMIQLAHRMKRTTARWKRMFEQLAKRVGKKKATCAVARRLLMVLYAMLRDGNAYQMPAGCEPNARTAVA